VKHEVAAAALVSVSRFLGFWAAARQATAVGIGAPDGRSPECRVPAPPGRAAVQLAHVSI
jgi:hypothetical protein